MFFYEVIRDWEAAEDAGLDKKEKWTPVLRHTARLFLLVGFLLGLVPGCCLLLKLITEIGQGG